MHIYIYINIYIYIYICKSDKTTRRSSNQHRHNGNNNDQNSTGAPGKNELPWQLLYLENTEHSPGRFGLGFGASGGLKTWRLFYGLVHDCL